MIRPTAPQHERCAVGSITSPPRQPRSPLASRRGGFLFWARSPGAEEPGSSGAVEAEEPGAEGARGAETACPPSAVHHRSPRPPLLHRSLRPPCIALVPGGAPPPLPPRARQLPCSRAPIPRLRLIVHGRDLARLPAAHRAPCGSSCTWRGPTIPLPCTWRGSRGSRACPCPPAARSRCATPPRARRRAWPVYCCRNRQSLRRSNIFPPPKHNKKQNKETK